MDILISVGEWQCPYCRFHRKFSTQQGCLDGASKHLAQHGKKLTIPRSNEASPVRATNRLIKLLTYFPRKERQ